MRGCWNRQTGTFEVRVSYGVGVQVPSLAPRKKGTAKAVPFLRGATKSTLWVGEILLRNVKRNTLLSGRQKGVF